MILVLDTETTGVGEEDEILQLSIIDNHGNELLNRYYKPEQHTQWPEAQRVNHISPEDVAACSPIRQDRELIQLLIDNASAIVGYNTQFDLRMLVHAGIHISNSIRVIDVMAEFAPIYGEWSEKHGEYKWQKLTTCAEYYGYQFHAHDSLEDAKATLYCWKRIRQGRMESFSRKIG